MAIGATSDSTLLQQGCLSFGQRRSRLRRDEILALGVAAKEGGDERAQHHNVKTSGPNVVERTRNEPLAEPAPFPSRRNVCVDQLHDLAARPVRKRADDLAVQVKLVPVRGRIVPNGRRIRPHLRKPSQTAIVRIRPRPLEGERRDAWWLAA